MHTDCRKVSAALRSAANKTVGEARGEGDHTSESPQSRARSVLGHSSSEDETEGKKLTGDYTLRGLIRVLGSSISST